MSAQRIELVAGETDSGNRVDKFITRHVPGIGRFKAAELCALGHVRIDGQRAKKSSLLRAGAKITVEDNNTLPAKLKLSFTRDTRNGRPCEVVWCRGKSFGVKFVR